MTFQTKEQSEVIVTVRFLVKDTKISCFISFLENSMMSS